MSRHPVMASLDYREELSDAEANDAVPFDEDEVDQVAMREGKAKVLAALGEIADLIPPSEIEQALWDNYYDAEKSVAMLSSIYENEVHKLGEATIEVLARLGEASEKVTPKQIKDSLWHYYFDIEKTVAYIDRTYINPVEKPKPKVKAPVERKYCLNSLPRGRYGGSGFPPEGGRKRRAGGAVPGDRGLQNSCAYEYSLVPRVRVPAEWHFYGIPWEGGLRGPATTFIEPPRCVGLLGGSGKPSKLQALAAARKNKKVADKQAPVPEAEAPSTTPSTSTTPTAAATKKEPIKLDIRLLSKRRRQESNAGSADATTSQQAEQGDGKVTEDPPSTENEPAGLDAASAPENPIFCQAARPSSFAATLFGPSANAPARQAESYPFPYTISKSYSAEPFLKPSPDDVVMAAQAQGSRFSGK